MLTSRNNFDHKAMKRTAAYAGAKSQLIKSINGFGLL